MTAVFDNTLERIKDASYTHSLAEGDGNRYWISTDRSIAVYGYRHRETKKRVYTIWKDDAIPGDDCEMTFLDFAFAGGGFEDPVLVDMITGGVYEIPAAQWSREGTIDRFRRIPVYDAPVLIAERSLIPIA